MKPDVDVRRHGRITNRTMNTKYPGERGDEEITRSTT